LKERYNFYDDGINALFNYNDCRILDDPTFGFRFNGIDNNAMANFRHFVDIIKSEICRVLGSEGRYTCGPDYDACKNKIMNFEITFRFSFLQNIYFFKAINFFKLYKEFSLDPKYNEPEISDYFWCCNTISFAELCDLMIDFYWAHVFIYENDKDSTDPVARKTYKYFRQLIEKADIDQRRANIKKYANKFYNLKDIESRVYNNDDIYFVRQKSDGPYAISAHKSSDFLRIFMSIFENLFFYGQGYISKENYKIENDDTLCKPYVILQDENDYM